MVWWVNCGYIYDLVLKSQCVMKSLFLTDIQTSLNEVYVNEDDTKSLFNHDLQDCEESITRGEGRCYLTIPGLLAYDSVSP